MSGINRLARLLPWALRRHFLVMPVQTINVIQLGIAFFLVFFAFNTASFIEEVLIEGVAKKGTISTHAGYNSLAIVYAVFTVSNFFAASVVHKLGVKFAMFIGGLSYAMFQASFLFLNEALLYVTSAFLGFGAAVIWTGQGKYLTLNSNEDNAEKHAGIFWAISQACLSCGGIFIYFVFHTEEDVISDGTLKILFGVFTSVTVLGLVLILLLRYPKDSGESEMAVLNQQQKPDEVELTILQLFQSIIDMVKTRRMLLLIVVFMYTGLSLSFWSSIYPTCIGFTKQLGSNTKRIIALNAITQGIGQATGGFVFGILGSKVFNISRPKVVFIAVIINLAAFSTIFISFPNEASIKSTENSGIIPPNMVIALTIGFFLGFGDATWNTQVFAALISNYPKHSAQAFSLFKFFQSLLAAIIFFCGAKITLQIHIIVLGVMSIAAGVCFMLAERKPKELSGIDNEAVPS